MELFNLFMQQPDIIKGLIGWILLHGVILGFHNTAVRIKSIVHGGHMTQSRTGRILDMIWYLMIIAVTVEFIIK